MKSLNMKLANLAKSEVIYGIHPVKLALEANKRKFLKLYVKKSLVVNIRPAISNLLQLANEKNLIVSLLDGHILDRLSNNGQHQGICMETSRRECVKHNFNQTLDDNLKLWVALESIYDPMNFGSIIRTCNFLGYDKIITSEKNSCQLTPVVSKASSGAMEIMDIESVPDFPVFIKEYKKRNWNIIGTSQNSSSPINQFSTNKNSIIAFGNEGSGLSEETLNLCDVVLSIVRHGQVCDNQMGCLNVNVASGIVLHHIRNSISNNS